MTRPGTRPVDALGGWSGLLLSAVPPALLVVVDSVAGLAPALAVATAVAAAVCAVRVRQGHAVGPAAGGLVGTAISAVIAWWTGTAAGFFALDLVWYLVAGAALFGSVVVRRPLVGILWQLVHGGPVPAAARGRLDLATGVWAVVFAARFAVQGWLQVDQPLGWLAAAKVAMGLPLTAVAAGVTVWAVAAARDTSGCSRERRRSRSARTPPGSRRRREPDPPRDHRAITDEFGGRPPSALTQRSQPGGTT